MKKVFVLIWFCVMFVAAQAQVEKGVSSTGQLGTTGDTRTFVNEKGKKVGTPRLVRTGKIIRTTIASVITSPTGTVTTITAESGGNVLSDGGAEVTARGVCWSTSPNPTLESCIGHTTDGTGVGEFTSELTGLLECTTYYVRAYATNSVGTTYGEQETFNTLPDMEYAINFGYSVDFGKVTIVNTSATSAVWKNASNEEVGTWISGTTPILPVGTYSVELTSEDCGTNTISVNILSSPICEVALVNTNETGFTPAYSGNYISALKDIDNNTYNVVQIGEQCWIKENLRATKYADESNLPLGIYGSQSEAFRYYPNNDETIVPTYGYLYNWTAVMHGASGSNANPSGVQGVCPDGWHVPSQAEFEQLIAFVDNHKADADYGYQNVGKALVTTDGWTDPGDQTVMPNNALGFSALPAGCAFGMDRPNFGTIADFFSSTILGTGSQDEGNNIYAFQVSPNNAGQLSTWKHYSHSVRCVRNEGCELSMDYTINLGNSDDFGRVTINSTNATAASWKDSNGVEIGTWVSGKTDILPVGKYTVELTGDCDAKTITGINIVSSPICLVDEVGSNETAFEPTSYSPSYTGKLINKMKDVDNNEYNVVQIGSQCFIKDNLKTTHFANGTAITLGDASSSSNVIAYCYNPGNDASNVATYGYLYNWYAAMNGSPASSANPSNMQGVCPVGWHVPSYDEWMQAGVYVNAQSEFACGSGTMQIAKSLASINGWDEENDNECNVGNTTTITTNNKTGFTGMPAGYFSGSSMSDFGSSANIWTTTKYAEEGSALYSLLLIAGEPTPIFADQSPNLGLSVRCVRGAGETSSCETTMDYTINMGNSADFGRVTINSTNATSASWKDSNDVEIGTWVSGKTDILPVGKYTVELTGTLCNKTIELEILSSPICTVDAVNSNETGSNGQISQLKDVENHTYNVVQIGSQCWTKENMRSKTYAGGDTLGYMHEVSDYPHYDYPNGIAANSDTYGLLYNWYAAVHNANVSNANPLGVQGICPEGWHVPSAAEFTTLTNYVSSKESFLCGDDATKIAKALSGNTGWLDKSTLEAIAAQAGMEGELSECMVSYDLTTNNAAGFSMSAAGICRGTTYNYDLQPGLPSFGLAAVLWTTSSSDENTATALNWYGFSETISSAESGSYKEGYWSVRCVRGAGNNTPSVTTAAISDTNCTSIICGGNVISDGGSEVTARGVCWSSNGALHLDVDHNHTTDGVGTGEFTSEITGLEAGNTYYIRAYATNAMGTFYGETIKYKHIVELDYTVNLGNSPDFGRVTINNADVTGATWRNASNEVIGTWTTKTDILPVGTYSVEITTPCISTTISGIEVKSSPICTADAVGTNEGAFTPSYSGTYINKLTDVDGNEYQVVQVGTQCWLKEDMRTKRYADGVAITSAYSDNATSEHVPHYINHFTYVDNHVQIIDSPELLYNGFAALKMNIDGSDANPSGVQGLCPDGWHVPSMTEVTALYTYVGQQEEYACNGDASKLGKALASNTGWLYDESEDDFKDCSIGTDFSTNNATGLSLSAGGILAILPFPQGLASGYWTTSPNPDKDDNNGGDEGPGIIGKELFIAATFTTEENYSQNTCAKIGFMGVRCVRGAGNNTPSVTTSAVSAVTGTTATCGGNVTSDGGSTVTARGVCWSTSANPTISDSYTTDGAGTGSFTSDISGLTEGTTYYVRAYATNSVGTAYGEQNTFTTHAKPTVTTKEVNNMAGSRAYSGGNIMSDGGASVTDRGVCWSLSQNPTIDDAHTSDGSGTGLFNSSMENLDPCVTYYVRAYATNSVGTSYGEELSFMITDVTMSYFVCTGEYQKFGEISISKTTATSAIWYNSDDQEIGRWLSGYTGILPVGTYSVELSNSCAVKTISDIKVFASPICKVVTVNSNEGEFVTSYPGSYIQTLTDIDNNTYNTVQIGEWCYMRENLRVERYADGTDIAKGTSSSTTVAYRYYPNNSQANVQKFGYLYNWKAAMWNGTSSKTSPSGVQGVCPDGWHLPSYSNEI